MQCPSVRALKIAGIVLGVCFVLGATGVHLSSQTSFCLSCHEMRIYQQEQMCSAHAKDAKGQEIGCAQCHIPKGNVIRMLAAKGWMGIKDLWVHTFYPEEELDRYVMQPIARRFTDDANCKACHQNLQRNAKNDAPISVEGKLAHANYLGSNGQSRSGCVGCHQNLAHLPVFDARIPGNEDFAKKLQQSMQVATKK
ncbi:MAG: NapC/NirT family cytochrome c [Desulfovibrionaceae bacterium]|nr:NapC/NirT family cytochrome c [Desulfovibrionaceae bacterium]